MGSTCSKMSHLLIQGSVAHKRRTTVYSNNQLQNSEVFVLYCCFGVVMNST